MKRIGIFVDIMGCGDQTAEDEVESLKQTISALFPQEEMSFVGDGTLLTPDYVLDSRLDVYLFDYGGMLPGCDGLLHDLGRSFRTAVFDCPNTLFVMLTRFGGASYIFRDYCDQEVRDQPNFTFDIGSSLEHAIERMFKGCSA